MRTTLSAFLLCTACSTSDKGVTVHNSAPTAIITDPVEDWEFETDETITFIALVEDLQDAPEDLSCVWASDRDGKLTEPEVADADGHIQLSTSNLSSGEHTISLSVLDSGGLSGSDNIRIFVEDVAQPPSISIRHPSPDGSESGIEAVPFGFEAFVSDLQDEPAALFVKVIIEDGPDLCSSFADTDGIAYCEAVVDPPEGDDPHSLMFVVEDTDGNTDQAYVDFDVVPASEIDNDGDGWSIVGGDCDDTDEDVHPEAFEIENGVDDDCDGIIDEGTDAYDDDGDGYTERDGDCDDDDPIVHPGPDSMEICDGIDTDCDGIIDDEDVLDGTTYYRDVDGDGHGDAGDPINACSPPAGYVISPTDCNDTDAGSYPGADEYCDGADNDCDGFTDEEGSLGCSTWYIDEDADGYGTTTSACLCASSTPYTSTTTTDCWDENPDAWPAAPSFHATDRGDGSFDYNCDSTEEREYTATAGDCSYFGDGLGCSTEFGWDGGTPTCGASGSWKGDCYYSTSGWPWDWGCYWGSSTGLTQTCR